MTLGEVLLWDELKGKQLGYQFSRQIPIDNFIVDFFCKDLSLAIEIDGNSHYHDDQQVKDKIRQEILEGLGVKFLRFDDSDVRKDINWVVNEIYCWIENKLPTPSPSKEGN
jgi:very-short-patch-repair endonuclease